MCLVVTFEYLNTPDAVLRFNAVRQQVRTQFGFIQQDLGVPNLVAWWELFTDDYFALIGQRAQQWARDAIEIAAAPFEQAIANERNLGIGPGVIGALAEMLNEIANMELPPNTSMQNPQPPGGTGGGGGS